MALKVGDTAYVTRHALTKGIRAVTVQRVGETGWLSLTGVWYGGREGDEVFATLPAAQQKAREMAERALKALAKKRARLEDIA